MKVFPLRKGYLFAEVKGLGFEAAAIRGMKIVWPRGHKYTRYTQTVKRGEMLLLFQEKGILVEFVGTHWSDGGTNQTYIERCVQVAQAYRQCQESTYAQPDEETVTNRQQPVTAEGRPQAAAPPSAPPGPDVHQRLLSRLQCLTPTQFEHAVGEFLKAKGIREVQVTGRSNDGGIDATATILFVDVKVGVQAKRYTTGNNVGIEPVQRLGGDVGVGKRFDRGIFITTSSFSPGARSWVQETGAPITLVEGTELVNQMIDLGLGIIEKPVVETEVDESFFEGLGR